MSDNLTDETLSLLTKNYARFLKNNYKKNVPSGKENMNGPRRNLGSNILRIMFQRYRGMQCHECNGFGHIQVECANTVKNKKALDTTWS